ncbi:hypothetical protein [Myxococcus sp. AB025B]|uniref:hypothetical protein n=1 Tax=Myxococcus sp. AB025B TaxID=2562794 RepID=UPI0018910E4F|nr:hypothetical protein [Myxococcus sp. AB025B]
MRAVRPGRRSSPWILFLALGVASVLSACSSDDPVEGSPKPDAGTRADGGTGSDAGGNPDAGSSGSDGGASTPDGGPRPLPPFTWGSGPETGSISGDVWTPGRDSTGLVNEASWALVPKGRWIEVAGTPLTTLDAEVKGALPGFSDLGSQGIAGVINAYSGIALDAPRARWWAFGGGHADSSNNGLYRFDMARMRWSIEQLPDHSANWTKVPWGNTYSGYPPAEAYAKAHPDSDVYVERHSTAERPRAGALLYRILRGHDLRPRAAAQSLHRRVPV